MNRLLTRKTSPLLCCLCTVVLVAPQHWIVIRQEIATSFTGGPADRDTVSISGDGRFVAFASRARLLPASRNSVLNVYVYDLLESTLTLESGTPDGSPADGDSVHPTLSRDGRFVLFESLARNLVGDGTSESVDGIYLRDHVRSHTSRVNLAADGKPFEVLPHSAVISADARFVVLSARGDPFNQGDGSDKDSTIYRVYRVALDTGAATLVSVAMDGRRPALGSSDHPSVSENGRVVAFASTAVLDPTHPPPSSPAGLFQMSNVYLRDLDAGITRCVGCAIEGAGTSKRSHSPQVSADGRFVVFVAEEITKVAGGIAPAGNIWLYDRVSNLATLVTRAADGHAANGTSRCPAIAASGEVVVFESDASNLACHRRCSPDQRDENLLPDIYLFDRASGKTRRISGEARQEWWEPSVGPAVDGRGRIVAFSSRHPITPNDGGVFNLFVWTDKTPD